ncbi:hypothetical protein KY284_032488, partial [Solanum tuberosum]
VTSPTEYPSHFEAILSGFNDQNILFPCLAQVHPHRSNISNSSLPQIYVKQSEYPIKIDAHKMFDEMLNNYCPKVFTLAPLDDPLHSDERISDVKHRK